MNQHTRQRRMSATRTLGRLTTLLTRLTLAVPVAMAQTAAADTSADAATADCAGGGAQPLGSTAFKPADRLAILNLVNSYGYLADTFGPKRFDELFTADASVVLRMGDKVMVDGLEQFRQFAGQRTEKYQREHIQRRHILSAPRIDYQDARTATGNAYLQYFEIPQGEAPQLKFVGVYSFRAVKTDGGWKLSCWVARTD